jgi:hypothetical protein
MAATLIDRTAAATVLSIAYRIVSSDFRFEHRCGDPGRRQNNLIAKYARGAASRGTLPT